MIIYDISLPLSKQVAEWPGDVPFALASTLSQSRGDSVNVAAITTSLHMATHVDAPHHVRRDAATIDRLLLDSFVGPCVLLDVSLQCHAARSRGVDAVLTKDIFEKVDFTAAPRLLLRTGMWTDHTHFPSSIPVIGADVPAFLSEKRVVLIGLDVPSVDSLDSKDLPIHHRLLEFGIHIMESLDLREPPEGVYELLALPLKIAGGDASPVRAVLRCASAAPDVK